MSNTNIEDVMVQLTETRNELSEEDLRLWDGLENERVSRIVGDDANKSLTLQVQDSVSGTERRLSTEVIHREQGDLDKLGVLNQLSQSLSTYRIKTDKEIEAERFARDILGINLDARITTAEASFNHKELKLYQDIQEVFTDLDGKYTSMDARIKKYEEMLQDITMDSIKITMDNGEINMGAWTILSQAREWDLEILAKMRGFQEKTNEDVNQALEELQSQLPITENIINEIMENLSESPLIAELRDALNESIDTSESLAVKLAKEESARAQAIIDLAYANAQALAAEKAALAESLAAEAQARADEVQEEADRRIESIRQIRADLAQDVGELNDQVDNIREGALADKAGILETVNNYKTELKSDIATVNTELLGALDGVNTLVTEVRGENEVTLNELTTYKSSNDVALAGVLSKVTTNISDTAANASKITGLTSSLATTNTELGTVRNTSANALNKANTAVTANSALATRVDSLAAAITDLGEGAETTVDVYAFNALKAEVGTNAAGVSSLVEQVNALGTNYTDLADGVEANTDAVSTLTVKQSEMNGDISQLSSDVTYLTSELGITNTALNTKASNQALSNLSTKLTTTDGKVAANTQQLTQLNTDLTTVRDGLETKASTEALNNLATDVTELEDGLAVNASAITNLKSEIDTELNKKATVTAVNGLTTKVEEVEGKTTTNANNLLALNTSVGNVVKGLANKLDASTISDYYTKSQTDDKAAEIAAGKVEEFNASLVIGGSNLFTNSDFSSGTTGWESTGAGASLSIVTDSEGKFKQVAQAVSISNSQGFKSTTTAASALNLVPGDTYTFSGWVRASEPKTLYPAIDGSGISNAAPIQVDTTWQYFTITKKVVTNAIPRIYGNGEYLVANLKIEKGTKATDWTPSTAEVQNSIDANSTAIQNTIAEVSRVDGRVTATNSDQTLLEGRVQTVEGDITKKADASALSSLDTRVGTVEGQYTTQASDITKLTNSLDTTIVDVGTAQTAAQNAMNAAGAKGKVIFGNTAPAVADRLVQNLWIDTTSNANTPKRWNGSAWVVVTDKVATDAAKAVSDLDTVVKTKADVTALNSLTTKVTDDAKKTVANTNSITELNSDIVKINNNLATKANASALNDIYTKTQTDAKATSIAAGEVAKYDASLVIGGKNLFSYIAWNSLAETTSYSMSIPLAQTQLLPHTQYTISTNITKSAGNFDVFVMGVGVAPSSATNGVALNEPRTITTNATGILNVGMRSNTLNSSYDKWIQIERGDTATQFTPSEKDQASDLRVEVDANATAIETTNAEVSRVDGRVTTESNRITTLAGRVTTAEKGLALKADATALNNVYTKTESDAKATSLAAGEISKYDASLVIGGTNLIGNSNFANDLTGWEAAGSTTSATVLDDTKAAFKKVAKVTSTVASAGLKATNAAALNDLNLTFGEEYTFSGWLRADADMTVNVAIDGSANANATAVPVGVEWVKFTHTKIVWDNRVPRLYGKGTFYVANLKIERGNKATDWSEADSAIVESLNVNASAIKATNSEVERVDGRVTSTNQDITGLKNRMTTVEGNKANVSAVNALTTRVGNVEGGLSTQANNTTALEASLASIGDIASLIANSKLVFGDTAFDKGANSVIVYNNGAGGLNKVERIARFTLDNPTTSSGQLNVTVSAQGSPGYGGFVQYIYGRPNAVFVVRYLLKLPVGYRLGKASNSIGTGSSDSYIGSTEGTGKYETYIRVIKCGATGTFSSTGHVTVLGSALSGTQTMTFPIAKIEVYDATDYSIAHPDVLGGIDANANAISTTKTEVSRIDGVVKGHVTDIRNLTTNIAGKADAGALSALTVKVAEEAGKISSQSGDLVSLSSSLGKNNLINKDAWRIAGNVGYISPSGTISVLSTHVYSDFIPVSTNQLSWALTDIGSGGNTSMRIALYKDDKTFHSIPVNGGVDSVSSGIVNVPAAAAYVRVSVPLVHTVEAVFKSSSVDLSGYATASALSTLDTKVEKVDGRVTTQASQIVTLTSDNTANKNALQVQAKVVDGVKANYMVKMETNGVIGGFGLIQTTGALGSVKTTFGVNANSFFIGAPASKKQPFIVTTTNQVVNGVKYPAGTYIDVALIANATIGNAKIADLNADKINAGTLDAARIAANSITADKLLIGGGNLIYGGLDTFQHFTTTPPNLSGLGSLSLETGWGLFGPKRIKFTSTAAGSYSYIHPTSNSQNGWLKLRTGQRYILSAFVMTSSSSNTGIRITAVTREGITASVLNTVQSSLPININNGWSRISVAFTAQGSDPYLSYYLSHAGSVVTSYWDGFMLEAVPAGVSSPSSFSPGGQTRIDGGTIVANSISADKISAAAIDTISLKARNGTFTAADGSKTVITGGLTEVYYPNGKIAIRLGVK